MSTTTTEANEPQPEQYDMEDKSGRDDLHAMMDCADSSPGYDTVGDWEIYSGDGHLTWVRQDDDLWQGWSGDVAWFIAELNRGDDDE